MRSFFLPGERGMCMYTLAVTLAYHGGRYRGWQRQGNTSDTLQQHVEAALRHACADESIVIFGAGRTDAGVHAKGQVASFRTETLRDPSKEACEELRRKINMCLPQDICATTLRVMPDRFHARLNARGKCYEYTIWNSIDRNVFLLDRALHVPEPLDVRKMQEAAQLFVGRHDFTAFCAYRGDKSRVRTVRSVDVEKEGELITIRFTGDGFLYKMVRMLSGALIEVGRGEKLPIAQLLEKAESSPLVPCAAARGLCLVSVTY